MTAKGARPTPRDMRLIRVVFDYGVVSSRQLASWFFEGVEKTTVLWRLRRLEKGHFIRKRGTLPDGTAVYLIDEAGAKLLGEKPEVTTFPRHLLEHEIETNNVRWRLERLGLAKTWMTERELRAAIMRQNPGKERSNLIVPDAMIRFRHFLKPGGEVQLEVELHAKSDERYRARFEKFQPSRFKELPFLWYLVRAQSCGERILRFATKYGGVEAKNFIALAGSRISGRTGRRQGSTDQAEQCRFMPCSQSYPLLRRVLKGWAGKTRQERRASPHKNTFRGNDFRRPLRLRLSSPFPSKTTPPLRWEVVLDPGLRNQGGRRKS